MSSSFPMKSKPKNLLTPCHCLRAVGNAWGGLFCAMKRLTNYSKNGRKWYVSSRVNDVALATDGHGHFEVFHIQSHNGRTVHGVDVKPAEYPPSNEQWGSLGWSFSDSVKASFRFGLEMQKAGGRL